MTTIDDLISEGKKFEIKTHPEYATLGGNGPQIHPSYQYIDNGDQYLLWVEKCKRFIAINYPNDRAINDFENASTTISDQNHLKLISILGALREYPDPCRINTQNNMGETIINVNQNQQQSQNQSQNFDLFMDAIKYKLTLDQFLELQKIAKESPNIEDAKPKIIEKLKNFGADVLSGIVANIIANPTIWNGLF